MPPTAGTVVLVSRPEETHARPPRPDRAVSIPRTPVVRQRRLERRSDRRSRRTREPGPRDRPRTPRPRVALARGVGLAPRSTAPRRPPDGGGGRGRRRRGVVRRSTGAVGPVQPRAGHRRRSRPPRRGPRGDVVVRRAGDPPVPDVLRLR